MTDDPRLAIGGNNPPVFDIHAINIEDLFALISDTVAGGTVTTDEQEAALDGLLDNARDARKAADAARADEKRPHDEAAKAVQTKWKPLLERCDLATAEIKRLLTPYRVAKQAAKDEAARKAREEAAAKEKAAQDALRQSDNLQTRFAAEEQIKQASKLKAVANKVDRSATGLRTSYVVEMVDALAYARWAWTNRNEQYLAMLCELASAEGRGADAIPGLKLNIERKAA
ncbi:hypothetical protein [Sphingomonas japonica]|uniref:Uncharacterized protein n=1 Tax=Sphingomonas japonica TaxID=511662 RepID=A0ABX0U7P9_9SPHN|nr:hypothetical protein [Sphingomonas japonica]NIJ24798.1 hypothetical protein [Sphingomonas japonica]